jgi:hypothetical protein
MLERQRLQQKCMPPETRRQPGDLPVRGSGDETGGDRDEQLRPLQIIGSRERLP